MPPHQRYPGRLAPVVDHVRENPRGDLSVETLARVAHFSPYHFHRVFTAVMGETVGTFVRRVRLERATQLMRAAPDRPLGEVALDSGFGSQSDFSRTFKRHYGMAPSQWDRLRPLEFSPASDGPGEPPPYDLQRMIESDDGPEPSPRLAEIPAQRIAYVRIRRPFEEGALARGYRTLRGWLASQGLPEGHLLGLSWDDVEITPPDQIRYDFASSVPDGVEGRGEIVVRDLPELEVVAAHAEGDLSRVARVWDHLYRSWLPSSAYEPANLPPFEWYRRWPSRLDESSWDLDCCIALRAIRRVR